MTDEEITALAVKTIRKPVKEYVHIDLHVL